MASGETLRLGVLGLEGSDVVGENGKGSAEGNSRRQYGDLVNIGSELMGEYGYQLPGGLDEDEIDFIAFELGLMRELGIEPEVFGKIGAGLGELGGTRVFRTKTERREAVVMRKDLSLALSVPLGVSESTINVAIIDVLNRLGKLVKSREDNGLMVDYSAKLVEVSDVAASTKFVRVRDIPLCVLRRSTGWNNPMELIFDRVVQVVSGVDFEGYGVDKEIASERIDDEDIEKIEVVSYDFLEDEEYQNALNDDDMVGVYLKEAGKVPLLSAKEEVSLAMRIEAADLAHESLYADKAEGSLSPEEILRLQETIWEGQLAVEHLIRANTRLVISIAKRFAGQGLPLLDLIQEGNIGLIIAVRKFDYRQGYRFSTYATWWIRQGVSRAVADQGRTIRVPVHMVERLNKLRKVTAELQQILGRDPLPGELAEKMGATEDEILNLIEVSWLPVSLEGMIENAERERDELGDFIEDTDAIDPSEMSEERELKEQLEEVLARLPPREAEILRLRYGLVDGRTHTL